MSKLTYNNPSKTGSVLYYRRSKNDDKEGVINNEKSSTYNYYGTISY